MAGGGGGGVAGLVLAEGPGPERQCNRPGPPSIMAPFHSSPAGESMARRVVGDRTGRPRCVSLATRPPVCPPVPLNTALQYSPFPPTSLRPTLLSSSITDFLPVPLSLPISRLCIRGCASTRASCEAARQQCHCCLVHESMPAAATACWPRPIASTRTVETRSRCSWSLSALVLVVASRNKKPTPVQL